MKENSSCALKKITLNFLVLHEKGQVLGDVKRDFIDRKWEEMKWNPRKEMEEVIFLWGHCLGK